MILTRVVKEWIEKVLSDISFVTWDRFSSFTEKDDVVLRVFGWIEREDSYKDFVVLEFVWDDKTRMVFLVSTSSSKYSKKIDMILEGNNDGHKDCERVENHFILKNVVRLDKI